MKNTVKLPDSQPTFCQLKVLSYARGSFSRQLFSIAKYPDGTITLDDGQTTVVQRPARHKKQRLWAKTILTEHLSIFFRRSFAQCKNLVS